MMAERYNTDCVPLLSDSTSLCSTYGCIEPLRSTSSSVPSLPDGKINHLFMSHCSEDQEWAEACVERLEQRYNIKCLWPRRDFTPGIPIPKLIEDGMSHAMKTVIVLSPEYIDSGWCSYERNLAFVKSVQEGQNTIIPILLKPCVIPDMLRTLNYIDVTKGENVDSKIVDAINRKSDLNDIVPHINIEYAQPAINGGQLSLTAKKEFNSQIRGSAWAFESPSLHQYDEIQKLGAKISLSCYTKEVTAVNNVLYLRRFHLGKWMAVLYIVLLCGSLGGFLSGLISTHLELSDDQAFLLMIICFCSVNIVFFPTYSMIYLFVRNKGIIQCRNIVKSLSLETVQSTQQLIFFHLDKVPILTFMYYNTEPCKLHLKNCILRKNMIPESCEDKDLMASNIADEKIKTFLNKYYEKLHVVHWDKLEESLENRHPTLKRKKCLCEIIEPFLTSDELTIN